MILKMERSSVLDYVKKIPGAQLPTGKPSKEEVDKQLAQLDKLKEALKKEKEELTKEDKPEKTDK